MGFCSKNVLKSAWFYTSRQTLVIFLSYFFFVIFKPSQTLAQPVPDLCTSVFKMTAQKIKKPLTSFIIHLLIKKRFLTDAKARCKGVWLLKSTICNLKLMFQIIAKLTHQIILFFSAENFKLKADPWDEQYIAGDTRKLIQIIPY